MEKTKQELEHSSIHKRNVAEFFSGRARFWRLVYDQGEEYLSPYDRHYMNKRKQAVLDILDRFSQGKTLRVLDAGCGAGGLLDAIKQRGHNVAGMDISREMLSQASRSAGNPDPKNTLFIQADLESVSFRDSSFDAVICVGVLQYLQDDKKGLQELTRILKPGGLAVITLPNILRISNFFDPYYYLRGIKYIAHRISRNASNRKAVPEPGDFSKNRMFGNRRYFPGQLRKDFNNSRLRSVEERSIGFGPLTFWQEPFLPEPLSLSVSDRMERASAKSGLRWLSFFSNRWVISLRKAA